MSSLYVGACLCRSRKKNSGIKGCMQSASEKGDQKDVERDGGSHPLSKLQGK